MKLYKIKMFIPAVPLPIEWTVEVSNPKAALKKAKGEIELSGFIPCKGPALESEILSIRDI